MANKKTLDELIMEVLREDFEFKDAIDLPLYKNNVGGTTDFIKTLAAIENPTEVLNNADLDELIKKPSLITFEYFKAVAQLKSKIIKKWKDNNKFHYKKKKKNKDDWFTAYKTRHPSTTYINAKEVYIAATDKLGEVLNAYDKHIELSRRADPVTTISAPELSTRAAASGIFSKEQEEIVKRFAPSAQQLGTTIEALTTRSKQLYRAADGNRTAINALNLLPPAEFLNILLLLDIFNKIAKDMDSGSGGYLFEYFLALLAGGQVVGQATDTGKMGAVDFEYAVGGTTKLGSAKYYSSKGSITQAPGGFPIGRTVEYFVGLKRQDLTQVGETGGETGRADPNKIVAVDIFRFTILQRTKGSFFGGPGSAASTIPLLKRYKGDISLSELIVPNSFVGTLYLAATPLDNFKAMMDRSITKLENGLGKAYESLKKVFSTLSDAKSKATQYISTGNLTTGNTAFSQLQAADNEFAALVNLLTTGPIEDEDKTYGTETGLGGDIQTTQREITETKSVKDLDKLIEQVILEHINK